MTGAIGFGISTKALKMLRPLPSYFVSSLVFKRSVRKVGSSDCAALCFREVFLLPGLAGAGCSATEIFTGAGDAALGGEPKPNKPEKRVAISTTATIASETAAITLLRFSVPRFTT